MDALALRCLWVGCVTMPFVVAAWRSRRANVAASWWAAAALAAAVSLAADPLAVALHQIDGILTRGGCGL